MKTPKYLFSIFVFTILFWQPLHAAGNALQPMADKSSFLHGYPEKSPLQVNKRLIHQLDNVTTRMSGISPNASVGFAVPPDVLITAGVLDFAINYSPALIKELSHIKLYLNDEILATLTLPKPLSDTQLNRQKSWQIQLKPELLKDYNQIRFQLVGYYTEQCQDDFNRNIWAELSQTASLELTYQPLAVDSELALLPEPFFYSQLNQMLSLPMVFAAKPSPVELESAAIVSSWFGLLADWRKADFPVLLNQLPDEHAVVFASNERRPEFLRDYPSVDEPSIEIISNPVHRYKKLLLVMGKDDQQLKQAALALAHAHQMMTGRTATITSGPNINKRAAYDAPRWLNTQRPVKLGNLIQYPNQLQIQGVGSPPANLNLRFPPDLFIWREQGVPLELIYRYTPSKSVTDTRLNLLINGQFMQGYVLEEHRHDNIVLDKLTIPFTRDVSGEDQQNLTIPSFKTSANNTLTFDFSFTIAKSGYCEAVPRDTNYGRIDENSTIDVSDYGHYIKMPNLRAFAQAGFPFTKYADLQKTLLYLDQNSSSETLNLLLNTVAMFSASTGYPANYINIVNQLDGIELRDKDILVFGDPQSFRFDKNPQLQVLTTQHLRALNETLYPGDSAQNVQIELKSKGPLASILGFQSPFNNKRSVIALSANSPQGYQLLKDTLLDDESLNKIKAAAVLIDSFGITSAESQQSYYVGSLAIYKLLWFHLSDHPILLALLSVMVLLILSYIIWRLLRVLTAKRLAEGE